MRKGNIIFIIGGARSGKSKFACELAKKMKGATYFIATLEGKDKEMKSKIKEHEKQRPKDWKIIEEPTDLEREILKIDDERNIIIIDCISLWISNLMHNMMEGTTIINKVKKLVNILKKAKSVFIIVSNEVGFGIVPKNKLAREYRDTLGITNQIISNCANKVYFIIGGVPLLIK